MPKKSYVQKRERDSIEDLHAETEIQRKVLIRGKNLAFSEDTCLEKKKVRSKMIPRKIEVRLIRRRELNMKMWSWKLAWLGFPEKNKTSYFLGLRGKTPVLRPALQSIIAPVKTDWKQDQIVRSSA